MKKLLLVLSSSLVAVFLPTFFFNHWHQSKVQAQEAQVAVLTPEADAYVRDGIYANSNYGADGWLKTKASSADYTRESFLRFDLASVSFAVKHAS
ncbi:hypothetical protein COT66_02145, partial [Candidatus Shapirobacteria bacterium CG09_land_8_20_14_0_10_49_15]